MSEVSQTVEVTEEEIEYQKQGFDLGGFFGNLLEAVPGTLSGVGAIRASRNPNLTTYAPSISGDSTYLGQQNARGSAFTNTNRPIGQGSRTTTIIISIVVVVLVLITLYVLLRKK